jgi:hypothetical protein
VSPQKVSAALLIVAAFAGASGCITGGGDARPAAGHVFGPWLNTFDASVATLRPGQRVSLYFGDYQNRSTEPVTITASPFTGTGLGTVVRVTTTKLGVLDSPQHAMASAIYSTDPPVSASAQAVGGCAVADLRPVNGYVVKPGNEIRFLYVVEMLRPGHWTLVPTIHYTQEGHAYIEDVPYHYAGRVAENGRRVVVDPMERPCLSLAK